MNSKGDGGIPQDPATGPLRILCVEDNDGDFLLIREFLRESDLKPTPELSRARNLTEALAALGGGAEDSPFAIVLLDLSLPDSSGSETMIRVAAASPRIPITILSGNADRESAVRMVEEGAQDYLLKDSLDSQTLSRSILYAMGRQRSRIEMAELNGRLLRAAEELRTAQMQLIQAEKLDSLGRLAAGVAHEVKNPLATIQLGVDYFRRKPEMVGESGLELIDLMQDAIERADNIIRGMVDYSRNESLSLRESNINRVVRKARGLVQHEITRSGVMVLEEYSNPIPAVRIDQGKVEQVLINLMMNAIQAMKPMKGGEDRVRSLHIRTFWDRLGATYRDEGLRRFERLRENDRVVVVEIRDEGPGVPEERINRIFEPFYTTKPTGEGTGLGLSVARNIIDLHRGHIDVQNVEDPRGLRVRILFKAVELPDAAVPEPDPSPFSQAIQLKSP